MCGSNNMVSLNLAPHLDSFLTVVHAKDDCSSKESADCLKEEIHGELSPALSSKQTQGQGHCGVQMAPCKCT